MMNKAPPNRRRFPSLGDEMEYLYHKLVYWFYERNEPPRARPFADRLAKLLGKQAPAAKAIRAEECRSLIQELHGNLAAAIAHRENEIRLIRQLHQLAAGGPSAHYVLRQYSYADLSDRLDLLAILHHFTGNLEKALHVLQESRELCESQGLPFDGQELWEEYLQERTRNCQPEAASKRAKHGVAAF